MKTREKLWEQLENTERSTRDHDGTEDGDSDGRI